VISLIPIAIILRFIHTLIYLRILIVTRKHFFGFGTKRLIHCMDKFKDEL